MTHTIIQILLALFIYDNLKFVLHLALALLYKAFPGVKRWMVKQLDRLEKKIEEPNTIKLQGTQPGDKTLEA